MLAGLRNLEVSRVCFVVAELTVSSFIENSNISSDVDFSSDSIL